MLLSAQVPVFPMHGFVGFLGVFVGSFLFLPGSRRTGSIFLALAGSSFFYLRFVWFDIGPGSVPDGLTRVAFISCGAIVAVLAHTVWQWLSRNSV